MVSCFFFFVYLFMQRDTNDCLSTQYHEYRGKIQFLELLIVASKLTFLKHKNSRNNATTQQRNNTKKTQAATMVSGIIFSCSIIKIKTHTLTCVWQQKKKRYVPLFLLLIVVSLSHVVSKRPKLPINTTRHNKAQKTTKQR